MVYIHLPSLASWLFRFASTFWRPFAVETCLNIRKPDQERSIYASHNLTWPLPRISTKTQSSNIARSHSKSSTRDSTSPACRCPGIVDGITRGWVKLSNHVKPITFASHFVALFGFSCSCTSSNVGDTNALLYHAPLHHWIWADAFQQLESNQKGLIRINYCAYSFMPHTQTRM